MHLICGLLFPKNGKCSMDDESTLLISTAVLQRPEKIKSMFQ